MLSWITGAVLICFQLFTVSFVDDVLFFVQVLSFPVHSMGWIELEESQVAPHNMSDTIADCISSLAQQRKDLWNTADTWGEVHDV